MLLIFIFLHCGLDYVILFVFCHIRILPLNLFFEKLQQKKERIVFIQKMAFIFIIWSNSKTLKTITAVVACVQKTEWGGRKKSHTISYRKWNVNTNKSVKTWINKTKQRTWENKKKSWNVKNNSMAIISALNTYHDQNNFTIISSSCIHFWRVSVRNF